MAVGRGRLRSRASLAGDLVQIRIACLTRLEFANISASKLIPTAPLQKLNGLRIRTITVKRKPSETLPFMRAANFRALNLLNLA